MKIRTIAIVTLFAFASTAYASATSYKHRHHHTAKMNAMARSAPSGPGLEAGRRDESRVGGKGVSNRPGD